MMELAMGQWLTQQDAQDRAKHKKREIQRRPHEAAVFTPSVFVPPETLEQQKRSAQAAREFEQRQNDMAKAEKDRLETIASLREDLAQKINGLTMNEFDLRFENLKHEIGMLREKAGITEDIHERSAKAAQALLDLMNAKPEVSMFDDTFDGRRMMDMAKDFSRLSQQSDLNDQIRRYGELERDKVLKDMQEELDRIERVNLEASNNVVAGWTSAMKELQTEFKSGFRLAVDATRAAAEAMSNSFESFFIDAIEGRLKKLGDYINAFLNDILRAIAQIAARQIAISALTSFGFSMAGAPGRASGGPVARGKPYVVGEHGPELFVPAQSGSIEPRMKGEGVNVSLNVINNTGQQTEVRQEVRKVDHRNYILSVWLDAYNRNEFGLRTALGR